MNHALDLLFNMSVKDGSNSRFKINFLHVLLIYTYCPLKVMYGLLTKLMFSISAFQNGLVCENWSKQTEDTCLQSGQPPDM